MAKAPQTDAQRRGHEEPKDPSPAGRAGVKLVPNPAGGTGEPTADRPASHVATRHGAATRAQTPEGRQAQSRPAGAARPGARQAEGGTAWVMTDDAGNQLSVMLMTADGGGGGGGGGCSLGDLTPLEITDYLMGSGALTWPDLVELVMGTPPHVAAAILSLLDMYALAGGMLPPINPPPPPPEPEPPEEGEGRASRARRPG